MGEIGKRVVCLVSLEFVVMQSLSKWLFRREPRR
jgi:hypothetical protein